MNPSIYPNSTQQGSTGPYSATSDLTNAQRQVLQPHQGFYSGNIYQQQGQPQAGQPQGQQQTQSPVQAQGYYMPPEVAASYQHQMYPGYQYMPTQQGPGQQQYPPPQYHQYPQLQMQGPPGQLQHQQSQPPRNYSNVATITDPTGQIAPPGAKPKVTTTLWEDEGTLCFQVEAKGICVARREDNDMINGTKLLNVAGMTRGRRDGILKGEKNRHVVKAGAMHLKGVWIPYERAIEFANKEKIIDLLYPLFVTDIKAVLYHPTNYARTAQVLSAAEKRKQEAFEKKEGGASSSSGGAGGGSAGSTGSGAAAGSGTGATGGASSNASGSPSSNAATTGGALPPLTQTAGGQYYYPGQQDYSGQNSRVGTPSRGPYPYLPQPPNYYQPPPPGVQSEGNPQAQQQPASNGQGNNPSGNNGENNENNNGAQGSSENAESANNSGSTPLNGLLNQSAGGSENQQNGPVSDTSPRFYHTKQEFDDRG